ncbi:helicase-related protein [Streptomyces sp. NPDC051207]|uniref:helicase-related protein n=1 Tax=Streptomyces sp. NPDC051207 TaxID=3154641 RepID=UPI003430D89C
MVLEGYAYHHAEVPQAVRNCLERAYRNGALRVLCATSTLSQGMNLPTKTVLVPDTWRGQGDRVSLRDFWNTAGRAGRAGQETEGHVVLIAKDSSAAQELRRHSGPGQDRTGRLHARLALLRAGHRPSGPPARRRRGFHGAGPGRPRRRETGRVGRGTGHSAPGPARRGGRRHSRPAPPRAGCPGAPRRHARRTPTRGPRLVLGPAGPFLRPPRRRHRPAPARPARTRRDRPLGPQRPGRHRRTRRRRADPDRPRRTTGTAHRRALVQPAAPHPDPRRGRARSPARHPPEEGRRPRTRTAGYGLDRRPPGS